MSILNLNQQLKRVELKATEFTNSVVFNYFNNVPNDERDGKFLKALYIGVLALMEDRLSAFLSKTSNELGTELESLKMIFEMKTEIFFKTAIKGLLAEEEIVEYLNGYFKERKLNDKAIHVGNIVGDLVRNKTGDIICEINGNPDSRIIIECKFDKSIKLGEIESKDVFARSNDTVWSQLIEAQANRDGKVSLMVFDIAFVDISILKEFENVGYIPGIGLISIINSQKGDYTNLIIAYNLARDLALNSKEIILDKDLLAILVNRIIKGISEVLLIKKLVENNIENNKGILRQLEKGMLLMEFNEHYLKKFLMEGTLTKDDLLNYYQGENLKMKYQLIEKDIQDL